MTYTEAVRFCVSSEMANLSDDEKGELCKVLSIKSSERDSILLEYKSRLISKYNLGATTSPESISSKVADIVLFRISNNV